MDFRYWIRELHAATLLATGPAKPIFLHSDQRFQAHQCAALPNVELIISLATVAEDDMVVEPFKVEKGGFYRIPTKPGLGVTLDETALAKYRIV